MVLLIRKVLVSFASKKDYKIFEEFFISSILSKNRIWPSIVPFAAPHVICSLSDKVVPSQSVVCFLEKTQTSLKASILVLVINSIKDFSKV